MVLLLLVLVMSSVLRGLGCQRLVHLLLLMQVIVNLLCSGLLMSRSTHFSWYILVFENSRQHLLDTLLNVYLLLGGRLILLALDTSQLSQRMDVNVGLLLLVGLLSNLLLLLILLLGLLLRNDVGLSLLLRHHGLLHLKELVVHVDLLLILLLLLQVKVLLLLVELLHGLLMLIRLVVRCKLIEHLLGRHHVLLLALPIRQVLLQVVQMLEIQLELVILLLVAVNVAELVVRLGCVV